jgi:prepilin signal peptidase PulO-like enzyme (type II secretory pathway)
MSAPSIGLVGALTVFCAVFDARRGIIPNRATYPSFALLLGIGAAQGEFLDSLLGAVLVGGSVLLLYAITRGRGIGMGDVKLSACIGAGLGASMGLIALGGSFVIGAAAGIALLLARRIRRNEPIPFAPFLALGSFASILCDSWMVAR